MWPLCLGSWAFPVCLSVCLLSKEPAGCDWVQWALLRSTWMTRPQNSSWSAALGKSTGLTSAQVAQSNTLKVRAVWPHRVTLMTVAQAVIWVPVSRTVKVTGSPLTGPSVTWPGGWEGWQVRLAGDPAPPAYPASGLKACLLEKSKGPGTRQAPTQGVECGMWIVFLSAGYRNILVVIQGQELCLKWILIWVLLNPGSCVLSYTSPSILEFNLPSVSFSYWLLALILSDGQSTPPLHSQGNGKRLGPTDSGLKGLVVC